MQICIGAISADALPQYNIIKMTLYRDKIKTKVDNFKKVNKEGRMTLDDDFTTFPGRGELLSDLINTCLLVHNLLPIFNCLINHSVLSLASLRTGVVPSKWNPFSLYLMSES